MKSKKQLFLGDLTPEEIAVIEARMRPNKSSMAGFLGEKQGLREVIDADARVLEAHGITHRQVGDRLESIMGQAFRQCDLALRAGKDYSEVQSNWALIDGFLSVRGVGWMGYQECPFFLQERFPGMREYCGQADHDFIVRNKRQGTEIRFPQLIAHLIRDHHFFEGETRYRLSPEDAINVLELKPGIDYAPKRRTETVWSFRYLTGDPDTQTPEIEGLVKSAEKVMDIAPGVKFYLAGDRALIVASHSLGAETPKRICGANMTSPIYRGVEIVERAKKEYIAG